MHGRRIITNIRGANAAGKTTLARYFHAPVQEFELGVFEGVKVRATLKQIPGLSRPVLLLGTYDDSKYSGCDKIKSKLAIWGAIRHCAQKLDCHVVFEGFYVSKSWGPYCELRKEIVSNKTLYGGDITWLWAFIHAPEELIFARSEARRSPDSRPIDKKELGGVVRQMANSRRNALQIFPKEEVLTLDPTRAPDDLYETLLGRIKLLEES